MKKIISLIIFACTTLSANVETVTIAILAKDKAHTLPEYLQCLEKQTWPKNQTYLYIRTNNNTDNTAEILKSWIEKVKDLYLEIYFDDSSVPEPIEHYKQHEWNTQRFKVLGAIRQDSVSWAGSKKSHYFVADCDNFITPKVIEALVLLNLPIVAPFLRKGDAFYSNYHAAVDNGGYFKDDPLYYQIFNNTVRGIIEVPVVHCTYLIHKDITDYVCYDDDSYRYEYVIFSDWARKFNIPQFIDNREVYGQMTMAETREEFEVEPWFGELRWY